MSYTLVQDILSMQATLRPQACFITDGDSTVSYTSLYARSRKLSAFLLREARLGKSDRVLLMLSHSLEFYIAFFATIFSGCIAVPLSAKLPPNRLKKIIEDCQPKGIITSRYPDEMLKESTCCSSITVFVHTAESSPQVTFCPKGQLLIQSLAEILQSSLGEITPPPLIDVDPALIIYTSGSTGGPKGIVCSHLNVISASHSIVQYLAMSESDVILNTLPCFFDYGLYQALLCARVGAQMIIGSDALFIDETIKLINEESVTGFPLVPSLAAAFLKYVKSQTGQSLTEEARHKMRFISSTGATFHPRYIDGLRYLFPFARIYPMYGLTECKRVAYLEPELIDRKMYSVGKPMPNVEAWIVDENSEKVPVGEIGTLVVRGSNVALGYWNDEELTSQTFRMGKFGERVLYTNDLFKQDKDGFLYFVGRKDEIIKSGGQRISLVEITNILLAIEGLSQAAVISEPHDELGEVMKAFVVLETGVQFSPRDIKRTMRSLVESNLMIPTQIAIVDELPQTMTGKIAKSVLKSKN